MKVKDLIDKLVRLDGELEVILSSDSEGNDFHALADINFHQNERWDSNECCVILKDERDEEEWDNFYPAVILYP